MQQTEPFAKAAVDVEDASQGDFSPAYVAHLLSENVRLREEACALRERAAKTASKPC